MKSGSTLILKRIKNAHYGLADWLADGTTSSKKIGRIDKLPIAKIVKYSHLFDDTRFGIGVILPLTPLIWQ